MIDQIINDLCPAFGCRAKKVPLYDAQKHAYLVDQYLTPSGNRCLTYVAVCDNLIVEFVLGHHYCMEYINSLRLLVPDVLHFKVVQTYRWNQKTHFSNEELHARTEKVLASYIMENAGDVRIDSEELDQAVNKIVRQLFDMSPDYMVSGGREVLDAYCRDAKVCGDFSLLLPEWDE